MRNEPIRVLMVVPNMMVNNGVASYAMNYYRNIDHSKIQMDFLLYQDIPNPYQREIIEAGNKVYVLPSIKRIDQHIRACKQILDEGHYDVVHDNSLLITYPLLRIARKKGIPLRILHSHNSKLGETKKKELRNGLFLPLLLRNCNQYAACSQLAGKAMFGDQSFIYVPNAIEPASYRYDPERRRAVRENMKVGKEQTVIATIARIALQKNPYFALQVMEQVLEKNPNFVYWWIGSGPMDEELAAYIRERHLEDRIKLLGSRTDMNDLYQAIDVFFLPSLFEGLPVTAIEAQAMALPCVLSDTITKELVFTDRVEYVSLDAGKQRWVDALLAAASQKSRDADMKLADSVFNIHNSAKVMESLYSR